jgi:hypothetical protein
MSRNNLSNVITTKTARQISELHKDGVKPGQIAREVETTKGILVSEAAVVAFLGADTPKRKTKAKAESTDD